MSQLPGLGSRIAARLVAIGFAKSGKPDVARFCAELGYRPQYVYAWLRGRTPTFENLERLAVDLRVSRSWLAVGDEERLAIAAPDGVLDPWSGKSSVRAPAGRERRETTSPLSRAPSGHSLQVLDFTRLREVTGKLIQLEAQLAAIFEAFPDLYIWVGADCLIVEWRGGRAEVPDGLLGEGIGQPIDVVFPGEAGRRLRDAVKTTLRGAAPTTVYCTVKVTGKDRGFEARLMPLDAPGSPVAHVLIVVRDITERLEAERAVRESEARYRALAEGSIQGICINQDGRIAFANQALCDIFGYSDSAALVGQPVSVLSEPEERARLDQYRQARLRGEPAPIHYEFQAVRLDGVRIWIENVVSVVDWGGRPGVLTTVYDVTQRRRSREEAAALAEAGRELAGTLDFDELVDRMLARVLRLLRVHRATLYTLEEGASLLRCVASAGGDRPGDMNGHELPLSALNLSGRAVLEGRAIVSDDLVTDPTLQLPEWVQRLNMDQGLRVGLAVPLIGHRGGEGALVVLDQLGRSFSDDDIALLVALADQAVIALDNARVFRESQRRLRHTEALLAVRHAVSSTLDVVEIARRAVRETVRVLGGDLGAAWRLDQAGRFYAPVAGYRIPKDALHHEARLPLPVTAPIVTEMVGRRTPLLVSDSHGDARFDFPLGRVIAHRSVVVLPLENRGVIVGLISIGWSHELHQFTPEDLRLVEAIGLELTTAFDTAELLAAEQRHARRQTALVAASRALSTERRLDRLAQVVVDEARRVIDGDAAALLTLEDGTLIARAVAASVATDLAGQPVADRVAWQVLTHAEAVTLDDIPANAEGCETLARGLGAQALLAVPILRDDRCDGVLLVTDRGGRIFESGDVEVLTTLARHVALALDNARLHEVGERRVREMSVLREIGVALAGLAPQSELLETVHAQLGRLLDTSNMVVRLAGRVPGQTEVVLRYREGVRQPAGRRYTAPLGLGSVVIARREAIRTDDYAAECRRHGVEPAPATLSYPYWLGMPMVAGDDLVGALALRSRERPFSDHDERMLREVATIVAISLRDTELFQALAAARDVLATIAGTRDGLVATDLQGRIIHFSPGAAAITGHSEGEARGLSAAQVYAGGRDEAVALMARMEQEGEVRGYDTTLITRDGGRVEVTLAVSPLFDPAGVTVGTLGVVERRGPPQG